MPLLTPVKCFSRKVVLGFGGFIRKQTRRDSGWICCLGATVLSSMGHTRLLSDVSGERLMIAVAAVILPQPIVSSADYDGDRERR